VKCIRHVAGAWLGLVVLAGKGVSAQQGMTRRQWEDSLQWMTDRHGMTPLPAKDQKTVLDYLEATFPPRAPAGRGGWQNPFAPR